MKCPVCTDASLVMTDRQGIEIDYCPTCRGVWLDRGELDKIIERTAGAMAATTPAPTPVAPSPAPQVATMTPQPQPQPRPRDWDDDDDYKYGSYKYKKKKSLLGELFDF